MSDPNPYFLFPGTAREALTFYAGIFGGELQLFTFEQFNRADGPADAIAHGMLGGGLVELAASDATSSDAPFKSEGLMFSLLGTADPATLRRWFASLAEGGTILDDLQQRPWGASDGQVVDRFGVRWLIGFEVAETA